MVGWTTPKNTLECSSHLTEPIGVLNLHGWRFDVVGLSACCVRGGSWEVIELIKPQHPALSRKVWGALS